MGLSLAGCMNLVDWNHLFTPNSQSAQNQRNNCLDHWLGRTSSTEGRLKTTATQDDEPKEYTAIHYIAAGVVVAIVGYGLWWAWKKYA